MANQIVAVRMDGGSEHKHIAGVGYLTTTSQPVKGHTAAVSDVVKLIDGGQRFFTRDYLGDIAEVVIVKGGDGARYIRTKKDGVLTDNLLRLPRYKFD